MITVIALHDVVGRYQQNRDWRRYIWYAFLALLWLVCMVYETLSGNRYDCGGQEFHATSHIK